jgi:hypothetical protein
MCRTHIAHVSGSQLKVKYQKIKYYTVCRVRSVSPTLIEKIYSNLAQKKCPPQQGNVQNPCYSFAGLRSRSHMKVKNWLDLILLNFNMYLNISENRKGICLKLKIYIWCAKIKICMSSFITLYCILTKLCPFLSLQIYTQSNIRRIFFKLYSNVHLNKVMCRTYVTFVSASGQGHTWRSKNDSENVLF